MDEPSEISDADFLKWAGVRPHRWAFLPSERREGWLDHLVARMRATADPQQRRAYWQLAAIIANADARHPPDYDPASVEDQTDH